MNGAIATPVRACFSRPIRDAHGFAVVAVHVLVSVDFLLMIQARLATALIGVEVIFLYVEFYQNDFEVECVACPLKIKDSRRSRDIIEEGVPPKAGEPLQGCPALCCALRR
jgi:hypothetical protein